MSLHPGIEGTAMPVSEGHVSRTESSPRYPDTRHDRFAMLASGGPRDDAFAGSVVLNYTSKVVMS